MFSSFPSAPEQLSDPVKSLLLARSSACNDVATFCTTAIVVSGFGIPLVLLHQGTVSWDTLLDKWKKGHFFLTSFP